MYKISKIKATSGIISVGGASGSQNVTEMWRDHFSLLYNNATSTKHQSTFLNMISSLSTINYVPLISLQDVISALAQQKKGKACGPDGLHMEAFLLGCHRLHVYLSLLFNLCLKCGYLPDSFMHSVVSPLVKCNTGDLTDVNNYRAIAISNSLSKILETALYSFIECSDKTDNYQFGFRKNHSTASCTYVFKQTVNHYVQRGSHVFCAFIDFNKAFDNVDYWLLFCDLINNASDKSTYLAARLLAYWYSNQKMYIRWQGCVSSPFSVGNGVRQGGILSPFLFRFYVRNIISTITGLGYGCNVGGTFINMLMYADDMVLLAPSWNALQCMLNTLEAIVSSLSMTFNTRKSVCMVFNPVSRNKIVCKSFPEFKLAGNSLNFVQQFKYVGHIIDNSMSDDADVDREIKKLFTRTNLLIRRFHKCSVTVKTKLFRAYCLCFYDISLWTRYSMQHLHKFRSCYHKCLKVFFGYPKYSSVTSMLLDLKLPSFNTILHNACLSFNTRLSFVNNAVVSSVYHMVFTARCTLVQSAVLRSHVVCLSVCLSVCNVGEL